MGFPIGKILGGIGGAVGGFFGGPAGALAGSQIGSLLGGGDDERKIAGVGRQLQPGPVTAGPVGLPSFNFSGATFVNPSSVGPQASLARLPSLGRNALSLTGFGNFFGGSGNGKASPISTILAKARAATGGPVTRNKLIDSAKICGLEVTAQTFGLEVTEVCMVVVKGRTRRRRGVSAADVRRTKRTIHFASKIRKDLKVLAK